MPAIIWPAKGLNHNYKHKCFRDTVFNKQLKDKYNKELKDREEAKEEEKACIQDAKEDSQSVSITGSSFDKALYTDKAIKRLFSKALKDSEEEEEDSEKTTKKEKKEKDSSSFLSPSRHANTSEVVAAN